MASAKDIVCPVEACKAAVGYECKLLENQPMVGRYHLDRVRAVGKQTREDNASKKEQDAKKLLRSTDRVFVFS